MFAVGEYAHGLFSNDLSPKYLSDSVEIVLGIPSRSFDIASLMAFIPSRFREQIEDFTNHARDQLKLIKEPNLRCGKIRFDFPYEHPQKGMRRILQQIAPLEIVDREISSYLIVFTDVTYLKRSGNPDYEIVNTNNGLAISTDPSTKILSSLENPFTKREREILDCIKLRMKTTEIATRLNISLDTVYNHKKRMLRKTGTKSTIELIVESIRKGWI